jgi:glycosyltransferase involved in cell wall biosynthesis
LEKDPETAEKAFKTALREMNRSRKKTCILFDEQAFLMQRAGGISRYIISIATELSKTGEIDACIFGGLHRNVHLQETTDNPSLAVHGLHRKDPWRINSLCASVSRVWRKRLFQKLRREYRTLIYHPSYYELDSFLVSQADATIVTFHDMIPEWIAAKHPSEKASKLPAVKKHAANLATLILTPSEATKGDVLGSYPELQKPVRVTHLASHLPIDQGTNHPLPSISGSRYFLTVGNRGDYKRGDAVIKAFVRLVQDHPDLNLIAFGGEELLPEEETILRENGLLGRWHHLQGDDAQLASCYRYATALVYPSEFEGFGLPVLEAMGMGCPVITSRKKSIPEVGGEAVLYADPDNIPEISAMMKALLDDSEQRSKLINRGLARSREFSWKQTALQTLEAYKTVCGGFAF